MLLFLSLFMSLVFCFGFLAFVAQAKMQFRRTCYTQSIELQKNIIATEKKLFALNPLSTALQLQYDLKIAEAGVSFLLVPVVAELLAEAAVIRARQFQLDRLQRGLIFSGQILIAAKTSQIQSQMIGESNNLSRIWSFFLRTVFPIKPLHVARVSVRARASGIAPNYELKPNYKDEQKVAFVWQLQYSTKLEHQSLVNSKNSFELQCQATPLKKENTWSVEI